MMQLHIDLSVVPDETFYGIMQHSNTNNIIIIEKMLNNRIEVKLQSQGIKNYVYTTGNLIRNIAMQWSTVRGESI